jgi:ACS family D-galactonate transporter-like MFS transporter
MPGMTDRPRRFSPFAPALALLFLCILINYVDRGNLSVAAPLLKDELHLSATQLGILLSAFFWTYTAMQFVSGWLVGRFNVVVVIAAGYLIWSLATTATGLVQGFTLLIMLRLLLGIGESVAFPACSKILACHVMEEGRGFANGVVTSGLRCGNAVGALGAGLLIAKYGWRPVFIGIGVISLLWLPAWAKWRPRSPGVTPPVSTGSPGFTEILRQRSFWGVSGGHFASNYHLYFMVTWLPYYLVHVRHLTLPVMAKTAGVYYLLEAISAMMTGWVADAWIRNGQTPTLVRKAAMAVGCALAATGMSGCALAGGQAYLAWLMVAGLGAGAPASGNFAFSQTLAGPEAAGRWTGLQNGMANFAGVITPALSGFIVDRTGSFLGPFAIVASVLIIGGCSWVFLVGRVEQVRWGRKSGMMVRASAVLQTLE